MSNENNRTGAPRTSTPVLVATAVVAALVGFAAVYGTLGRPDNLGLAGSAQPAAETAPARRGAPGLPSFVYKAAPEPVANVNFTDESGAERSLADFRGKVVLLNLWATWCAPCREEMPSLDRLEKDLGSDKFQVVALAVDRSGIPAIRKFLDSVSATSLKLYADTTTRSGSALKAIGMPTTILIDAEGREIGRLPGPAQWDSPDAKALIQSSLGAPSTR